MPKHEKSKGIKSKIGFSPKKKKNKKKEEETGWGVKSVVEKYIILFITYQYKLVACRHVTHSYEIIGKVDHIYLD